MSDQALAEDRLWSIEDASYYLGVPVQTLYSWRGQGVGPPGRRVGRRLRYRPEDVKPRSTDGTSSGGVISILG